MKKCDLRKRGVLESCIDLRHSSRVLSETRSPKLSDKEIWFHVKHWEYLHFQRPESVSWAIFRKMLGKPFRSPLLKKVPGQNLDTIHPDSPPAKRRRLSDEDNEVQELKGPQLVFKKPGISTLPRKPLAPLQVTNKSTDDSNTSDGAAESYYNVLWYITSSFIHFAEHKLLMSYAGESTLPKSTRHGMGMAFSLCLTASLI